MGLCLYVDLCFHASSLPCLHTFWHAIPTSLYIFNVFYFLVHRGLWGLVVVRLLWLSGRALAAQARGVLGSLPGDCCPFHFPLFSPHDILYFQCRVSVLLSNSLVLIMRTFSVLTSNGLSTSTDYMKNMCYLKVILTPLICLYLQKMTC